MSDHANLQADRTVKDAIGTRGPMSAATMQAFVTAQIQAAATFIDAEIAPYRQNATLYYRGALFGNEEEGRSQVISRDVHDTVNAYLPSLMRIFTGPENVVEFVPQGPEDQQMAEQATDYMNWIVMRDNPGFQVLYDCFKDALIRRTGVIKFWWDSQEEIKEQTYSGLNIPVLTKLMADLQKASDVELVESSLDPDTGYSVKLRLTTRTDRAKISSLPAEEFLIDRNARSDREFTIMAHRASKTVSELIAMGHKLEDIQSAISYGADLLDFNIERLARQPTLNTTMQSPIADQSQQHVMYVEAYTWIDADGDDISELHKVCCAGPQFRILSDEVVSDHPFAAFSCDPEPHTFFGDSIAEKVMDIQKIKTGIFRASLDSLALSIFPRMVVAKNGVEIADVLNTEIGAVIRADNVNQVQQLEVPFVGQQAFPMLEYMDQVRESRTGISRVSQGLDPESLQNATAAASAAQFTQSQQHIELVARIFAETGMKRLFRGLLRLVAENQREDRVVDLRGGQYVTVDPRGWRTDMDVTTNVALGTGTSHEKLMFLGQVKATQEGIIKLAGPQNPLAGLKEYYNTLAKMAALFGYKDVAPFFKDPSKPPAPGQQQQPQAPADPMADPKMLEAHANAAIAAKKLELDWRKHQDDMANKQADRVQALQIAVADIQAKYKTAIDTTQLKSEVEKLRMQADLVIQASEAQHGQQMDHHQFALDKAIAIHQATQPQQANAAAQ